MSEFFGRLMGKAPAKRHMKRRRVRVVRVKTPTFRKSHKRLFFKSRAEDKRLKAYTPGKRKSKSRRRYYEYRVNRADLNRSIRL